MTRHGFAIALVLVLCAVSRNAGAQNADNEKKSREHVEQAEMYMKAKVYDLAIEEYKKGYELVPRAHGFLFNIGLAYEQMGDKEKAIAAFEQYVQLLPKGSKAPEARARMVALRRALEEEKAQQQQAATDPGNTQTAVTDSRLPPPSSGADLSGQSPGRTITQPDGIVNNTPGPVDTPAKSGRSWARIALGASLIAAGVLADRVPARSRNGELEALDFLPVGLYGLGTMFVIQGAF